MSAPKAPKVGDPVLVAVDARTNSGSGEAPGVIVRVFDEDSDNITVNARVFLDSSEVPWVTSVAWRAKRPDEDDETVNRDVSGVQRVAFKP